MSIRKIVKHILSTDEQARKDDHYLFAKFIEKTAKRNGVYNHQIECAVKVLCSGKYPISSSIVREWRYVQSAEPELTDKETVKKRNSFEADYREKYRKENN